MRKLWIDTDTAFDDAVALLMALREPTVQVLGIGVVMGNVSLERAIRNALISVERAGTYAPPVYAGARKPLYRDTDFAVVCHGVDGLSDRGYADPAFSAAQGNAVDAMQGEGRIDITTGAEGKRVWIEVKDTGKGIARKNFKTVFNPGYTTKKRGWGLGLTLVKRIVEEYHGGRIFVKESELGVGTTFRIELPSIA